MAVFEQILRKAGNPAEDLLKVLDFGCAAGRLLRFYPNTPGKSELWGVDINARYIGWCQNNLSPPFLFATITTAPHLPFEDNYFDLIYCGSVFAHTLPILPIRGFSNCVVSCAKAAMYSSRSRTKTAWTFCCPDTVKKLRQWTLLSGIRKNPTASLAPHPRAFT